MLLMRELRCFPENICLAGQIHVFSRNSAISNKPNYIQHTQARQVGLGNDVYITIDIDGFDPACAPGTGTPEPGGLDWYQVTALLRLVAAEKNVVAADIVEVSPVPGQVVTEFLAARLAYKLMCYVQMRM